LKESKSSPRHIRERLQKYEQKHATANGMG